LFVAEVASPQLRSDGLIAARFDSNGSQHY
jgi:hypothetical protein